MSLENLAGSIWCLLYHQLRQNTIGHWLISEPVRNNVTQWTSKAHFIPSLLSDCSWNVTACFHGNVTPCWVGTSVAFNHHRFGRSLNFSKDDSSWPQNVLETTLIVMYDQASVRLRVGCCHFEKGFKSKRFSFWIRDSFSISKFIWAFNCYRRCHLKKKRWRCSLSGNSKTKLRTDGKTQTLMSVKESLKQGIWRLQRVW